MSTFPLIGETYSLLSAISWAVATILFTAPSRRLRAEALNLFKTTLATVLLIVTLVILRGGQVFRLTDGTEALYLAASGVVGISIADTLYFWCLREIGAWRTLALSCLAPPFTILLSAFMVRSVVGRADWLGIGVALAGVLLVTLSGRRRREDGLSFTRNGTLIGAVMYGLVALGIVLTKLGTAKTGSLEASTIRIVVAVPGILLIEAVRRTLGITLRAAADIPDRGRMIAGSIVGTYVAYILFIAGIKHAHPGIAIALASTSPAFVIPLSAVFLKERVSPLAVVGTGIALAGVVILFVV